MVSGRTGGQSPPTAVSPSVTEQSHGVMLPLKKQQKHLAFIHLGTLLHFTASNNPSFNTDICCLSNPLEKYNLSHSFSLVHLHLSSYVSEGTRRNAADEVEI